MCTAKHSRDKTEKNKIKLEKHYLHFQQINFISKNIFLFIQQKIRRAFCSPFDTIFRKTNYILMTRLVFVSLECKHQKTWIFGYGNASLRFGVWTQASITFLNWFSRRGKRFTIHSFESIKYISFIPILFYFLCMSASILLTASALIEPKKK